MILQKLQEARNLIKSMPQKKAGKNKFSDYDYFTPEQINKMVHDAEIETGLIHLFSMSRDEFGLHGELNIYEIETNEHITFIQATDIPQIKATNISQQIGGAVTYTNRYMLMTAYDISDNSLDFDSKDNREKEEKVKPTAKPIERKPISDDSFAKMCDAMRKAKDQKAAGNIHMGQTKYYTFDDQQTSIIQDIIDNLPIKIEENK
jgi:hypothetical protein